MSACDKHAKQPAWGYNSCPGCEVERQRKQVKQLQEIEGHLRKLLASHDIHWRAVANALGGICCGGVDVPVSEPTSTGGAIVAAIKQMKSEKLEPNELEREIAYHAARSDIECYCVRQRHSGPHIGIWYDITTPESDEEKDYTLKAVRYLFGRKLLKSHTENPNLVRPLDMEG